MTTQEQSVPRYFSDFVLENARQHQDLTAQIGEIKAEVREVKGELRIIRVVGIAMLVALLGLLGTGISGLVAYFINA